MSLGRVCAGSITSSMKRRSAANGAVARPSGRAWSLALSKPEQFISLPALHIRSPCHVTPSLTVGLLPLFREHFVSERNVPMLLRWVGVALILEQREGADEFGSGLGRLDHFVDEAAFGGDVGAGELFF
jgi:hypothetical protein